MIIVSRECFGSEVWAETGGGNKGFFGGGEVIPERRSWRNRVSMVTKRKKGEPKWAREQKDDSKGWRKLEKSRVLAKKSMLVSGWRKHRLETMKNKRVHITSQKPTHQGTSKEPPVRKEVNCPRRPKTRSFLHFGARTSVKERMCREKTGGKKRDDLE